jgi:hypothetical protein
MNDQQAETVIKLLKKVRDRMLGVGVLLVAIFVCLIVLVIRSFAAR